MHEPQHTVHQSQPVSGPVGLDVDPGVVLGLVMAVVLAYVVIRYIKAILLMVGMALLLVIVVGLAKVEPIIEQILAGLDSTD